MGFFKNVKRMLKLPPKIAVGKAKQIARRKSKESSGFNFEIPDYAKGDYYSYFVLKNTKFLKKYAGDILDASRRFCRHEFNLLGSGWVKLDPGLEARGFEGIKFTPAEKSRKVRDHIGRVHGSDRLDETADILDRISPFYEPIDYRIDFKCGYVWDAAIPSREIKYGEVEGPDIKAPWELGRMQDLPLLAYATAFSNKVDSQSLFLEFRNRVFEFFAANPIGKGPQWTTAMEAAIRTVNFLATRDLFESRGFKFDSDEDEIFKDFIYRSFRFVSSNLERGGGLRGNHYLVGIAGLAIVAAYLPSSPESDAALAFAIAELIEETNVQFLKDGGNFEASTNYHIFSLEAVLWALWVLNSLPKERIESLADVDFNNLPAIPEGVEPDKNRFEVRKGGIVFPEEFPNKLENAVDFCAAICDEKGGIPQIGDNDSGRFLILEPDFYKFDRRVRDLVPDTENKRFIFNLARVSKLIFTLKRSKNREIIDPAKIFSKPGAPAKKVDGKRIEFPDFGLYVFNRRNYRLIARCGEVGQFGKGGHAHNDALSFVLSVAGESIIVDPGSYVYTASKKLRNRFRSVESHNVFHVEGKEPNGFAGDDKDDLFWIDKPGTKILEVKTEDDSFYGRTKEFGTVRSMKIGFSDQTIEFVHKVDSDEKKIFRLILAPRARVKVSGAEAEISVGRAKIKLFFPGDNCEIETSRYSERYGVAEDTKTLVYRTREREIPLKIEII